MVTPNPHGFHLRSYREGDGPDGAGASVAAHIVGGRSDIPVSMRAANHADTGERSWDVIRSRRPQRQHGAGP